MKTIQPSPLLTFALVADALVTGAVAALQLALPGYLSRLLVLPEMLLVGTGLFLVGYTALLVVLARSKAIWSAIIQMIVIGNVGWAAGCIGLLLSSMVVPGALGVGFVLVQALSVLAFAALEFAGLRSSPAAPRLTAAHA